LSFILGYKLSILVTAKTRIYDIRWADAKNKTIQLTKQPPLIINNAGLYNINMVEGLLGT